MWSERNEASSSRSQRMEERSFVDDEEFQRLEKSSSILSLYELVHVVAQLKGWTKWISTEEKKT